MLTFRIANIEKRLKFAQIGEGPWRSLGTRKNYYRLDWSAIGIHLLQKEKTKLQTPFHIVKY